VSDVSLGTILVDSQGFTLYRLNKDSMNKSVCTPACAKIWPPLLVTGSGSPVGGSGVTGLGTIKVAAGEQVTYKGMPLYTFTGDSSAGQTHGQNVTDNWGTWFVVVTKAPAGGGVTTTTAAGGTGVGF
jgi:predicted lipoprotein with Yx(FWY)xxD motif